MSNKLTPAARNLIIRLLNAEYDEDACYVLKALLERADFTDPFVTECYAWYRRELRYEAAAAAAAEAAAPAA